MSHLLLVGGGRPAAQPRQLTGGLLTQQHVAARVTQAAGTRVSELPGHVASSADPQLEQQQGRRAEVSQPLFVEPIVSVISCCSIPLSVLIPSPVTEGGWEP